MRGRGFARAHDARGKGRAAAYRLDRRHAFRPTRALSPAKASEAFRLGSARLLVLGPAGCPGSGGGSNAGAAGRAPASSTAPRWRRRLCQCGATLGVDRPASASDVDARGGFARLCRARRDHFPQAMRHRQHLGPALVDAHLLGRRARSAARGGTWLSPVVDVARDSRWGRIEEPSARNPHLVSEIGLPRFRGFQVRRCRCARQDLRHAQHMTATAMP